MKTLQQFTIDIKMELITKVIKNAKLEAWVQRHSGLIKSGRTRKYVRGRLVYFDQKMF